MKIYTGTGDDGRTSLFSGERVAKSDQRLEVCGELDELNACIGAIAATWETQEPERSRELCHIQGWLLDAGAWLATTPASPAAAALPPLKKDLADSLETYIDTISAALPELRQFVLPGGHLSAAHAHMARTVCRRAERRVTALPLEKTTEVASIPAIVVFLNRLSDYLFVLARYLNHRHGQGDRLYPE
ncbi:MAG: ATP:cob(I)alamin adenosyltransferase [Desulfobulbus propionicus]|nr:MAG: ATP:cob(I)alamin adenosyltransferase [Desulfobulbus propionicus]